MVGKLRATRLLVGVGLGLLTACATGVRLSDSDRARLAHEKAIPVLVYETPLPRIQSASKTGAPAPADVRRAAGSDPAQLVAHSFTRLLDKKHKLKTLKVEPHLQPRPVADSGRAHQARYKSGVLLELWVEQWGFQALPADPNTYKLTLSARTRLTQLHDGRELWTTGRCAVGAGNNSDWRVTAADFKQTARLRKILAGARDECARRLTRDFDSQPDTEPMRRG